MTAWITVASRYCIHLQCCVQYVKDNYMKEWLLESLWLAVIVFTSSCAAFSVSGTWKNDYLNHCGQPLLYSPPVVLRSVCQGWLHERMTAWITVASRYCIHHQCCVQYVKDNYMKEWLLESLWLAVIVFTSSAAFSVSGTWKNDYLNHCGQPLLYSPPVVLRSVCQGWLHERMTAWITVASRYCIHHQCCVQYVKDDYMKEWLLESLWLAVIVLTSSAAFSVSGTWKNDYLNHCCQPLLYSPPVVLRSVCQGWLHERMTAWITVASRYCIHHQCCVKYVRDDYMKEWLLESLWLAVIVFTSSAAFSVSGTCKNDYLNHCSQPLLYSPPVVLHSVCQGWLHERMTAWITVASCYCIHLQLCCVQYVRDDYMKEWLLESLWLAVIVFTSSAAFSMSRMITWKEWLLESLWPAVIVFTSSCAAFSMSGMITWKEWLLESLWLAIIVFTSSCAAFSMSGMITWKNDCLNHYGQLLLYSPPVLPSVYQGHERMTAWITVASHYCIHHQCCVKYVRDDYMKEWLLESLWLAVIVFTSSACIHLQCCVQYVKDNYMKEWLFESLWLAVIVFTSSCAAFSVSGTWKNDYLNHCG